MLKAKRILESAQSVYVACHTVPDGDAVGSLFGLGLALQRLGKACTLACPDPVPAKYDFLAALENVIAVGQEFAKQSDDFDVVLSPTTAQPAPRVGVLDPSNPDRDQLEEALNASTAFTQIYNVSGAPAASVPLYWTDADVPIGVQIGARYGDETTIFKLSGQLEAARPWARRRPSLMPV